MAERSSNIARPNERASLWLDLVRALSAQTVLLGHLGWFDPLIEHRFPPPQSIAVVVFYLISGYLIIQSITRKLNYEGYDFTAFFIDRFCRIYPPYVAALFFVAVLDTFYIHYFPAAYAAHGYHHTIAKFLPNLFFLEKINVSFGAFGSASQFWTLPPEWWLYMAAGYLAFTWKRADGFHALPSKILLMVLLFVPFSFLTRGNPDTGIGLSAVWLMGGVVYGLHSTIVQYPRLLEKYNLIALLRALFCICACYRYHHSNDAFDVLAAFDLAAALLCSLWLCSIPRTRPFMSFLPASLIRFGAAYSYSLYLTHYSILMFCSEMSLPGWFVWLICNLFAVGFAWLFERPHKAFAARLHRIYH